MGYSQSLTKLVLPVFYNTWNSIFYLTPAQSHIPKISFLKKTISCIHFIEEKLFFHDHLRQSFVSTFSISF